LENDEEVVACASEKANENDNDSATAPVGADPQATDDAAHPQTTNSQAACQHKTTLLPLVVLTLRRSPRDARCARWFGRGSVEFLCGLSVFLNVTWLHVAPSVPVSADVRLPPQSVGALPVVGEEGSCSMTQLGFDPSPHAFLIRPGYVMFGEAGDGAAGKDCCIRLSQSDGFAAINV
jgi:hypothetical protein